MAFGQQDVGEEAGLRSWTMEEIRESPNPEQKSERKLRPSASRSLAAVREKKNLFQNTVFSLK